jgi:RHS repeat-associated protein
MTNTWDAMGNRVGITVNGASYSFTYDPEAGVPAVLEENRPSGVVVRYYRTPDGALIARKKGTDWRYYHYDELGSTRLLTDGSGNVTDTYSYDPWGNITSHVGSTNDNPYLYIGELGYYTHYQDPEFGLLHLGFRFYDPKIGRFTQQDPIGDGLNWYEYVEGNPLAWADPYGLGIIDLIQTGLDVAGCAPVIGEAADCANGLICLARRDYVGAGLSFTSMIPVVGDAIGKGGKVTRKVVQKVAKKTGKVAKVAKKSKKTTSKAYHYTRSSVADSIEKSGLRSSSGTIYATPIGNLSPLQAQIDLALSANRGLPGALFEIDIDALQRAGVKVSAPRQVGRAYNMPGGGIEILIRGDIVDPKYLKRIR